MRDALRSAPLRLAREADGEVVERLWSQILDGHWELLCYADREGIALMLLGERPERSRRPLSRQEELVVAMTATGAANKRISYELQMSPSTVSTHLRRALAKMGFSGPHQASIVHAFLFGKTRAPGLASPAAPSRPWAALRMAELTTDGRRIKVVFLSRRNRPSELTLAECEVAWSAAQGLSNSVIAVERGRSARTIANQLASAFRKLGVASRSELAAALLVAGKRE